MKKDLSNFELLKEVAIFFALIGKGIGIAILAALVILLIGLLGLLRKIILLTLQFKRQF